MNLKRGENMTDNRSFGLKIFHLFTDLVHILILLGILALVVGAFVGILKMEIPLIHKTYLATLSLMIVAAVVVELISRAFAEHMIRKKHWQRNDVFGKPIEGLPVPENWSNQDSPDADLYI